MRAEIPESVRRYALVRAISARAALLPDADGDYVDLKDLPAIKAHWLEQLKEELKRHRVEGTLDGTLPVAKCSCGWRSDYLRSSTAAEWAARKHIEGLLDSIPIEEGGEPSEGGSPPKASEGSAASSTMERRP